MRHLITGVNGTVGCALRRTLEERGDEVVGWDRARVPIDDPDATEAFLREVGPDTLFHLAVASQSTGRADEGWVVNVEWPAALARITHAHGVPLVFTSTAMVFSNSAKGPFTVDSAPDAAEGYGAEKREAERRVREQSPDARVVRLGWQIGDAPGSNNMIDHIVRQMEEHGVVRASRRWLPACSFLADTVEALAKLPSAPPGLYQIDSNARWNFHEIVSALNALHESPWAVEPTDDFVYDQRLLDDRLRVPPLSKWLKLT